MNGSATPWLLLMLILAVHGGRAMRSKLTKLRFYVHDVIGGENPTVWRVAKSNLTDILPSGFGELLVLDNLITYGPDIGSSPLGRIQGLVGLADLQSQALVMLVNVWFTYGEFQGNTLSILGRNSLADEVRELPIVGGTGGVFRMARGHVLTRTVFQNDTYLIYRYDIVVCHTDSADNVLLAREGDF